MGILHSNCDYFSRKKDKKEMNSSERIKHCFSEGRTIVLDYSGQFHSVQTLSDLKEKLGAFFPHMIKCFFDPAVDPKHSYVKLLSIYSNKGHLDYISFEFVFKQQGQIIISIYPYKHFTGTNGSGLLELSYDFPPEAHFNEPLDGLISWVQRDPDFSEPHDMGKSVYHAIKNSTTSEL